MAARVSSCLGFSNARCSGLCKMGAIAPILHKRLSSFWKASESVSDYRIELAQRQHLAELPAIELAAATIFPEGVIPPNVRLRTLSPQQIENALLQHCLWVAVAASTGQPVGFAMVVPEKDAAVLAEVDVHPEHQRKGVGRALIQAAIDWADAQGIPRIVLTTFGDLPWNAPFYERFGFRHIDASQLTDALAQTLREEAQQGLQGRVAMERLLRVG